MAGNLKPLQDAVSAARLRRNALAGAVRSALMQLERTPAATSPTPQAKHERNALADALAALLRPAPEPIIHGVDAELARAMRDLDAGYHPLELETAASELPPIASPQSRRAAALSSGAGP